MKVSSSCSRRCANQNAGHCAKEKRKGMPIGVPEKLVAERTLFLAAHDQAKCAQTEESESGGFRNDNGKIIEKGAARVKRIVGIIDNLEVAAQCKITEVGGTIPMTRPQIQVW